MLRDSPCGDTSNAATVAVMTCDVSLLMETKNNIFSNLSARVAVCDVSPCGLLRKRQIHVLIWFWPVLLRYWWIKFFRSLVYVYDVSVQGLERIGIFYACLLYFQLLFALGDFRHGPKNIALIGPSMV
jgi:hypothetical protein